MAIFKGPNSAFHSYKAELLMTAAEITPVPAPLLSTSTPTR